MYFKRVLHNILIYKKELILNIIFSVLYAFFSALAFLSLMPMLEVLFNGSPKINFKPSYENYDSIGKFLEDWLNFQVSNFSGNDTENAILFVVGTVIILFFLKNLTNYFSLFFSTLIRNSVIKDIKEKVFDKIIVLPLKYFSENKKGDLIARMSSDVLEVQTSYLSIVEIFIRDPLTIVFTLLTMFIISFKLTLFVLFFIPISGLVISFIGKSLKKKSLIVQKEQAELMSITEEVINGIKVIKTFLSESFFKSKFKISNLKFLRFSNRLVNRQNIASPLSEFLGILVIGVLLWYGGKLVLIDMELKPAAFITYMGLAYGVLTPAKSISKAFYSLKKGNAAAERVFEIIDLDSEFINDVDKEEIHEFTDKIEFKKVSFSYEKNKVLKNLSFEIDKGELVAIVGLSGSGKSTLVNLIPKFYSYGEGEILIDGKNINNLSIKDIRKLISIVSQESILFNTSIKENILLDKLDNSNNNTLLEEASTAANAFDFIHENKEGFEYNVGDNGVNLSGGQKQRIAIARAIASKCPILILDEATSALDSKSEKLVQDALDKIMKEKTSIVIAHRLSTIKNADKILVLDDGEIIESGSHSELLNLNGIYSNLIKLQSIS
ncbi:MAG: ABC transporter transmembrane domain-containing protein [Bacteroidota bacterium]|nr:ABC transporter transmembrane domain-containing protein [Bacteroidota bacterium]